MSETEALPEDRCPSRRMWTGWRCVLESGHKGECMDWDEAGREGNDPDWEGT